jgi:hypothetical protein
MARAQARTAAMGQREEGRREGETERGGEGERWRAEQ